MGTRLEKFRALNRLGGQLKLDMPDRGKMLLATYLCRLRERIPFIPHAEFRLSFPFERSRISYLLRSNDIDHELLEGIFVRREYDVPARNPRRILDLGGNIGTADLFFHAAYPDAEIVTVEPLPENLAVLRRNLAINGVRARVIEGAVSNSPGKARFFLAQTAGSSLIQRDDMSGRWIDVECLTVPEIMKQAGWDWVDILKVDIEGAEKRIFGDCTEWIGKVGMIVGELHDGYTVEEFNRDTGGQFECSQVFEYPPPGCMKGLLAVRRLNQAPAPVRPTID